MSEEAEVIEPTPVVNINGTAYDPEELDQDQRYLILHIQDLDQQIRPVQMRLEQLQAARESMVQGLIQSVEADTEASEVGEAVVDYLSIVCAIVTCASAIAAITPSKRDDAVVAAWKSRVMKLVDLCALNFGYSKDLR